MLHALKFRQSLLYLQHGNFETQKPSEESQFRPLIIPSLGGNHASRAEQLVLSVLHVRDLEQTASVPPSLLDLPPKDSFFCQLRN